MSSHPSGTVKPKSAPSSAGGFIAATEKWWIRWPAAVVIEAQALRFLFISFCLWQVARPFELQILQSLLFMWKDFPFRRWVHQREDTQEAFYVEGQVHYFSPWGWVVKRIKEGNDNGIVEEEKNVRQQIFAEHLLHARHGSRCCGQRKNKTKSSQPSRKPYAQVGLRDI